LGKLLTSEKIKFLEKSLEKFKPHFPNAPANSHPNFSIKQETKRGFRKLALHKKRENLEQLFNVFSQNKKIKIKH
jgi:hypothetical protein